MSVDPLSDGDRAWLAQCFAAKAARVEGPLHSNFRVSCIITYTSLDGKELHVTGNNVESTFLGAGACAEVTACTKILASGCRRVRALYLVSDSPSPLRPGLVCRDFLLNLAGIAQAKIVLASQPVAKDDPPVIETWTMAQLYPHPALYRRVRGDKVQQFAERLARRMEAVTRLYAVGSQEHVLYGKVVAASAKDNRTELYTVQYGSGVLWSDGTMKTTHSSKVSEFVGSLDAVSKLLPSLEDKRDQGIFPVCILQCDQWGILHPPFAVARSHLMEGGFSSCSCLVHDDRGILHVVSVADLCPLAAQYPPLELVNDFAAKKNRSNL